VVERAQHVVQRPVVAKGGRLQPRQIRRQAVIDREAADADPVQLLILTDGNGRLDRVHEKAGVVAVGRIDGHPVTVARHQPLRDALEEELGAADGRIVTVNHVQNIHGTGFKFL